MDYNKIPVGSNPPHEVSVIIEIPMNSGPIKYEFDDKTQALVVDRVMQTSMQYPCNYGFIPHTLAGDGDPVDVLVYMNQPLIPGSIISVKPIGVLITEDEKGKDEKILAVPVGKVDVSFHHINSYKDLPEILVERISHFFTTYKSLEKGKWVKVSGWEDASRAHAIINEAILRNKK